MTIDPGRREFLKRIHAGAAGLLAAGYTATSRGFPVNETIQVGCIGTGGRCQQLMGALRDLPGARLAAVCDVWDVHLESARKRCDDKAVTSKNFRELLERTDIDAVIIGAPDHWHVPMTIEACAAGKDVYVEKPLTHSLEEGAAVLEAQAKHHRIVQVGMQQRSMPQFQEGLKIIQSGELGKIHKVHLTWNRNTDRARRGSLGIDPKSVDWQMFLGSAPTQPFDEYRFRNWRWFWDFGGGVLTDLMVHFLDVANWYLDLEYPALATTIGDHYLAAGLWETPDTVQTLLQYPKQEVEVYFEGTFSNARNGAMLEFMGSEGTLYLDRGRYEIHPERHSKVKYKERVIGAGPRGADFYGEPPGEKLHLANWLECIRSRSAPNAPVEAGVKAVLGAHLGNQAYRTGQVVRWQG